MPVNLSDKVNRSQAAGTGQKSGETLKGGENPESSLLQRSRSGRVTNRMAADLRAALDEFPDLAAISLWVNFADDDSNPDLVARTDGQTVFAGPDYANLEGPERLFVVLHELLHVALAHPARLGLLKSQRGKINFLLFNVACDAIVNATLSQVYGLPVPRHSVKLEEVTELLGKPGSRLSEWSCETLYLAIIERRSCALALLKDFRDSERRGFRGSRRSERRSFTGRKYEPDLSAPGPGAGPGQLPAELQAQIEEWAARMGLVTGNTPGLADRLARELPQVKTPWERILRNFLFRRQTIKKEADFARPHRRWLSLERQMLVEEGVPLPFAPATSRDVLAPRLAVVLDTSGSISPDMLNRFCAEIASIMARTGATLLLLACDCEVTLAQELKGIEGRRKLREFKYKGGGGTDFRPAIAQAARWEPDALVYFTDLEGEAGDPPRFPVLWAVPPFSPDPLILPWGKLLRLE